MVKIKPKITTQYTKRGSVDKTGPGTEHDAVGEVENVDVVVEGGGEGEAESGQQRSHQGCRPQTNPVSENSSQEGEEESAAHGERSHQRAFEGGVLYSSCLQVILQLDEDDAERVDDLEDNSIDNEGADHDQPGL